MDHRNLDGGSYLNRENIFSIIESDFKTVKIKKEVAYIPSIFFVLPKMMELNKTNKELST